MTKSYFIKFLFPLLLVSCTGSIRTDEVDFTQGFTDGNSKVWVVSKTISPDGAITMNESLKSDVYIFYQSGACLLTNFQKLSRGNGQHGKLKFDHERHNVMMLFPNEKRDFEFEFVDENKLVLYPLEGSDFTHSIELIPFPELN
ncbi:MAG: hypothetical protein NWR96_01485 [Crocinitomicaceae bacterium]|jgi:hypothetical protein|nr:hypothetical protein [Crocinitomicaceae bacterium]MDP4760278.1 hypothetical protein [Crocinitomicaceae bacterium]